MKHEFNIQGVRWVKITEPTEKEINELNQEFPLHPLVLKELLIPTIRPKVDMYETYFYMVLHVPVFDEKERKTNPKEIDFILLQNAIITISYETVRPLEEFAKIADHSIKSASGENETAYFLYSMMRHLFSFSLRELDHIQENINTLEDIMFYGKNEEIVHDMYIARRDIIDFRRTIQPQEEMFQSLEEKGALLYGEGARPFLRNLTGQYYRICDILDGHKETILELYETNESIVTNRLNRTMKFFTVLAFLTFIPSLIANVFGMNVAYIPLSEHPNAFWIIISGSIAATLTVFLYFKIRKIL